MSNPIISCGIYAAEMVIFYLFFSLIAERKTSRLVCLICGLFLFEIGSAVNLLFHNNVLLNTITSICSKTLFAYFFFIIWATKRRFRSMRIFLASVSPFAARSR